MSVEINPLDPSVSVAVRLEFMIRNGQTVTCNRGARATQPIPHPRVMNTSCTSPTGLTGFLYLVQPRYIQNETRARRWDNKILHEVDEIAEN